FAPANTAHFTLTIPHLEHDFKVLAFQGTEAITAGRSAVRGASQKRSDHGRARPSHQAQSSILDRYERRDFQGRAGQDARQSGYDRYLQPPEFDSAVCGISVMT